jgi:hypothetical protein
MMTFGEEKEMLERMRSVVREAGALTRKEMLERVDGLTKYTCGRLMTLLIGEGFVTKTFESQWTKSDGRPGYAYVYRLRPRKDPSA